ESLFLLRMPVGLLHRAARGAERIQGAARRIRSQLARFRIGMLVNFPGPEIEEFIVADVLKHQSLLAVADDDPVPLPDFELLHAIPVGSDYTVGAVLIGAPKRQRRRPNSVAR